MCFEYFGQWLWWLGVDVNEGVIMLEDDFQGVRSEDWRKDSKDQRRVHLFHSLVGKWAS